MEGQGGRRLLSLRESECCAKLFQRELAEGEGLSQKGLRRLLFSVRRDEMVAVGEKKSFGQMCHKRRRSRGGVNTGYGSGDVLT